MYTFQNNRGEKRAMFTESLLCADAALGELSPWSSASGLFFFLCPFHRWESGGIESSGRLPRVTGSRMRVQAVWPSDLEPILTLGKKKKAKEKCKKQKHVWAHVLLDPHRHVEEKEAGAPRRCGQGHLRGEAGQRRGPSVAFQPIAPHNPSPGESECPWQQQRSENTGLLVSLIIEEASRCNQAGDHPGHQLTRRRKNSSFQMLPGAEPRAVQCSGGGELISGTGFLSALIHRRPPSWPLCAYRFWDSFKQYLLLCHIQQMQTNFFFFFLRLVIDWHKCRKAIYLPCKQASCFTVRPLRYLQACISLFSEGRSNICSFSKLGKCRKGQEGNSKSPIIWRLQLSVLLHI